MKKIFFFFAFITMMQVFSQPIPKMNIASIPYDAHFIFEGVVIDTMYYNGLTGRSDDLQLVIDENGKRTHLVQNLTAHKIYITKIFKGNLNVGTVELIIEEGVYWQFGLGFQNGIAVGMDCSECFKPMKIGTKGIFFCRNAESFKKSPMKTDNVTRLKLLDIGGKGSNGAYYLFDKKINSKEELYKSICSFPNTLMPKQDTTEYIFDKMLYLQTHIKNGQKVLNKGFNNLIEIKDFLKNYPDSIFNDVTKKIKGRNEKTNKNSY